MQDRHCNARETQAVRPGSRTTAPRNLTNVQSCQMLKSVIAWHPDSCWPISVNSIIRS